MGVRVRLVAAALQSDDPSAIERACDQAEAAGLGQGLTEAARRRAQVLREARSLEAAVQGTESLMAAVRTGDAAAIERACGEAEALGVSSTTVNAARRRVRQLRETSLLALAVHGGDPEEIERECGEAAASGVSEGMVATARERAQQLREAQLLTAAVQSTNVEEIERACEEAAARGVSQGTILAARRRVRGLREERMLAAAVRGGNASDIERTCDEAEAAGVGPVTIAAARQRAQRLREADAATAVGAAAQMAHLRARHLRETVWLLAAVRVVADTTEAVAADETAPNEGLGAAGAARILEAARERAQRCLGGMAAAAAPANTCTVCLELLGLDEQDVCMLSCRHAFHITCVEGWLQSQGTCPNCRLRADAEEAVDEDAHSGQSS